MVRIRLSSWLVVALCALFLSASHAEAVVTAGVVGTTLTVTGDAAANAITVRVVAGDATRLEVLVGGSVIGSFSRSTFSSISVTKTHSVPAGRRLTLNIAAEDPSLADNAVATQVIATQPILVERAQYWPFTPDRWYEAHNSFGGTALGTKWGLAEGRVGGPEGYQTYVLLANASATQSSDVTITFLRTDGTTVAKSYTVGPTSRFNVHVNGMVPELVNESFGAVVHVTSGPGIFVERALYSDSNGVVFAAGTNALATRLP